MAKFTILARNVEGHDAVVGHADSKAEAIEKIGKLLHDAGGDILSMRGSTISHVRPWLTFGYVDMSSPT